MKPRPTHKEKTLQAFRVYMEVMETAAWLKGWMRGPLEMFDLTQQGFRLLLTLYEEGPMRMQEAAKKLKIKRQTLDPVMERLEKRGWVKRQKVNLRRAEQRPRAKTRLARSQRRKWGIGVIGLTPEGEDLIGRVFPRHAKVLKALMRALLGREQRALVEICRKLRAGAILKFMSELAMLDEWESEEDEEIEGGDPEVEEWRSKLLQPRKEMREAGRADEPTEPKHEAGSRLAEFRGESAKDRAGSVVSEKDRAHLPGIAVKMRKFDVLKAARNTFWNQPPDEERDTKYAVTILKRVVDDGEREVLERLGRKLSERALIEMLHRLGDEGKQ